jgi:hypothetical protein
MRALQRRRAGLPRRQREAIVLRYYRSTTGPRTRSSSPKRGEGLHHLAFLVADFDEQLAAIREADPETNLLIDGTGPGNPVRWAYLDGGKARGTVIELLERTPLAEELFGRFLDLVR